MSTHHVGNSMNPALKFSSNKREVLDLTVGPMIYLVILDINTLCSFFLIKFSFMASQNCAISLCDIDFFLNTDT